MTKLTLQQTTDMLEAMPIVSALWWFIENTNEEDPNRTDTFFYLRKRVGMYQISNRSERRFENLLEQMNKTRVAKG